MRNTQSVFYRWGKLKGVLVNGDCLEVLKTLEDNSVDSIVTDPPYGIGFMGKAWDSFTKPVLEHGGKGYEEKVRGTKKNPNGTQGINSPAAIAGLYDRSEEGIKAYQSWCYEWAVACFRVLKPGGHLLASNSPRMYHRMAIAIEDAGFEIRDQIMWVYGSGFPKSLNLGGGWGTALKPAHEPICMARKPLSEKNVAENVLKWGTGGLNIDGSRVEADWSNDSNKRGWQGRPGNGWHKDGGLAQIKEPSGGRFPANLIHDGSDEVVGMFPNETARFFYTPKASKAERNAGLEGFEIRRPDHRTVVGMGTFEEKGVQPQQNSHPTVKPVALMKYLVKLITPPNGTVLDPFMGSGSTGIAAKEEGFGFIGIERDPDYFKIAEARITGSQKQLPLALS